MGKRTKRPWKFDEDTLMVRGPDGGLVAFAGITNGTANGPLLSAAPDLVEALEIIRQIAYGDEYKDAVKANVIGHLAEAAINKIDEQ